MPAHIKLGKIFGIELGLHYSWLIIAFLIAFSLAANFRFVHPDWSNTVVWGSALITALLFFACLIAHELAHSLVAQARNLPVKRITLFALGGVSQIEREAPDAKTEFLVAIAGPITSCALGLLFLWIARSFLSSPEAPPETPGVAILLWLGYINIVLGLFNLIPAFPLDGGRVLRAILWWSTGSMERATRIAARVGQLVGALMIAYGIILFFAGTRTRFNGLWLSFIGWFLVQAAEASYQQLQTTTLLKDLRAGDLMSSDCVYLDSEMTLQRFVEEQLLRTGRRCFVVTENNNMVGLITPHQVLAVERSRWPEVRLRDVMRPLEKVHSISPETPVAKAIELMARENVNQLPVVANHHVEGMLSRDSIVQVLHSRAELKAA